MGHERELRADALHHGEGVSAEGRTAPMLDTCFKAQGAHLRNWSRGAGN